MDKLNTDECQINNIDQATIGNDYACYRDSKTNDTESWYETCKNGTEKLNKGLLAEELKTKMDYIMVSSRGEAPLMYLYNKGVYCITSKANVCGTIESYIKPRLRDAGSIFNIYRLLTYKTPIKHELMAGDEDIINVANGLYNIKTKQLIPHTNNYISYSQLLCRHDLTALNQGIWDKFINDLTAGDSSLKMILQEYAGLTLSNISGYRVKRMLLLYGLGDTGKSKFIEVLCKITGNSINMMIQGLSDKFALASIYGKRIVFNGDLPHSAIENPSVLKEISGGDRLSAEFKGKDRFEFEFTGVMMFACNNLPYIKGDQGEHLFNRFLIIPCKNVIPEASRDKHLVDKLLKEQDYIFQWALEGLERLVSQNYIFTQSKALEAEKQNYMLQCDSVRAFVDDNCSITGIEADKILATELYREYTIYCKENGNAAVRATEFAKRLDTNHKVIKYKTSGNMHYKGIKKSNV
jgi:putative DNA primase/helicase